MFDWNMIRNSVPYRKISVLFPIPRSILKGRGAAFESIRDPSQTLFASHHSRHKIIIKGEEAINSSLFFQID
jgi:hypothetical protein